MNPQRIFAEDLRAHAYIEARGLSPQIVRDRQHACESCKRLEMLPAVLNVLEAQREQLRVTRDVIRGIR